MLVFCGVVGGVAAVAGEVEESGGESGFVESFGDEFFLYDCQSYDAVFGAECGAVQSGGGVGLDLVSSGDDDVLAGQVAASPFDGPCLDVGAVFGCQGEAGAGFQGVGDGEE